MWHKSRKNSVKVLLAMDVGGSMHPYIRLCSQLFTAVNRQSHFKDLRTYYFHNCVYDHLFADTRMTMSSAVPTSQVLHDLSTDYKLILVGVIYAVPVVMNVLALGILGWRY